MGLDLHDRVIPDDCRLLDRSRLEPDFGNHLEFFKSYALMSQAELKYEFDSVYKIYQSDSDESFRYLQELFGQFKAFYAAVADREGVIICMS